MLIVNAELHIFLYIPSLEMPKPGGCSPAYTVFYDAFPGKKPIDIDLVPCFNIDGWPPDKIARKINPSWIAIDDVVNRAMKYYDVVCKTCPEGRKYEILFVKFETET